MKVTPYSSLSDQSSKMTLLEGYFLKLEKVIIMFSGGIDSSFLLATAINTLKQQNVLPIIGVSKSLPDSELADAEYFCKELNIPLTKVLTDELLNDDYLKNDFNRCYYCKVALNEAIQNYLKAHQEYRDWHILDGLQADDKVSDRPGVKANDIFKVKHPLFDLQFTKTEIRDFSKELGLNIYNKPESACLSSRVMKGTKITSELLDNISKSEEHLKKLGFNEFRVRIHELNVLNNKKEYLARIEFKKDEDLLLAFKRKSEINKIKNFNVDFITIDLEGYKSGGFSLKVL